MWKCAAAGVMGKRMSEIDTIKSAVFNFNTLCHFSTQGKSRPREEEETAAKGEIEDPQERGNEANQRRKKAIFCEEK